MVNLSELKIKFAVTKLEDVKYLNESERAQLENILNKIESGRISEGKKENTYLVVNTDEVYVGDIVETLKRHGHWG